MLFSIIVPIYKVEAYLPQCIESVLKQEFKDFELILVDDGSPDNCGKICNEYAALDKRIVVIHKKNGGLSDARNAGLKVAKGDYIVFLDSDDYIAKSILNDISYVIKENKKLDMINCAHINTYPNRVEKLVKLPFHPLSQVINREHLYSEFIKNSVSSWSAGKNVYCREIIASKELKFKVGLIGAEDCDFFMRFVRYGNRFIFLNSPLIHYRQNREGSITSVMSKEAILGQLQVFCENFYIYGSNKNIAMQKYFAKKFVNTISLLFNLNDNSEIKECTDFIKKHKEVIKKVDGIKYLFANIIWSVLGYYYGSVLLEIINSRIRKR